MQYIYTYIYIYNVSTVLGVIPAFSEDRGLRVFKYKD